MGVSQKPSVVFGNEAAAPQKSYWPFDGIFGTVDRRAAQRGFQVYKEVCSACHALEHLYYRNLADIGFSAEEIKEIAKNYNVTDGPNESGDYFQRPAIPTDKFVKPFQNEEAAKASNGGAAPPDLSLIIKSRENGPNLVYSILTGYGTPPEGVSLDPGLYYNKYFPGGKIAMPPPLTDGLVSYMDGTSSSAEQMARDVVIFLQWAAEPEMERRKSMGIKAIIFLAAFTFFFYKAKKRIWKDVG